MLTSRAEVLVMLTPGTRRINSVTFWIGALAIASSPMTVIVAGALTSGSGRRDPVMTMGPVSVPFSEPRVGFCWHVPAGAWPASAHGTEDSTRQATTSRRGSMWESGRRIHGSTGSATKRDTANLGPHSHGSDRFLYRRCGPRNRLAEECHPATRQHCTQARSGKVVSPVAGLLPPDPQRSRDGGDRAHGKPSFCRPHLRRKAERPYCAGPLDRCASACDAGGAGVSATLRGGAAGNAAGARVVCPKRHHGAGACGPLRHSPRSDRTGSHARGQPAVVAATPRVPRYG